MYSKSNNNNKDMVYIFSFDNLGIFNIDNDSNKKDDYIKKLYKEKLQVREQPINKHAANNAASNTNTNIQEVYNFLQKHVLKVGSEQAIKDFQRGLNILNKYNKKSLIEAKRPIEEDGIFGCQTYSCLENICQKYTSQVIQKYIRRGAVNNAIFDTKNNVRIDTDKTVLNIYNHLSKEKVNV